MNDSIKLILGIAVVLMLVFLGAYLGATETVSVIAGVVIMFSAIPAFVVVLAIPNKGAKWDFWLAEMLLSIFPEPVLVIASVMLVIVGILMIASHA